MNVHRIGGIAALSLIPLLIGSGAAQADSGFGDLTSGGYVQEFGNYGTIDSRQLTGPGTASIGQASVEIETAPGGAVLVKTPAPTSAGSFFATASESYYAEIVGSVTSAIPLRLYYNLAVSSTVPGSYSAAEVVFGNTFNHIRSSNGIVVPPANNGYLTQYISTNSAIKVTIDAQSQYGGVGYADPLLVIDPDWSAANPDLASKVSLTFSDGIQNGFGDLAVPEPATWAMMLAGFGLAGASLRRRASRPAPAGPSTAA